MNTARYARGVVERWFQVRSAGSTVSSEIVGGATTFMTMAYILFVNGAILAGAGLPPAQVLTVTALVAGVMTIAMGVAANYPFAVAPGWASTPPSPGPWSRPST